jgi:hypothetical protein
MNQQAYIPVCISHHTKQPVGTRAYNYRAAYMLGQGILMCQLLKTAFIEQQPMWVA